MRIAPTGSELLSTARAVLRERLLPHLPQAELPTARAIGRAMAVAGRKLQDRRPALPEDLELLETARTTLRETLLGRLPKERQYDARLVAKAIAIATKELMNGEVFEREELARLSLLMDAPSSSLAGEAGDVHAQLEVRYARLAAEIRGGRMDPGTVQYSAIYAHLRGTTRQALDESHPEYLQRREAMVAPQQRTAP